jgi:hypothetical protein
MLNNKDNFIQQNYFFIKPIFSFIKFYIFRFIGVIVGAGGGGKEDRQFSLISGWSLEIDSSGCIRTNSCECLLRVPSMKAPSL